VHVNEGVAVLEEVSPAVVGGLGGSVDTGTLGDVLHGGLGLGAGTGHHGGLVLVLLIAHTALPLAHTAVLGLAHLGDHVDDEDEGMCEGDDSTGSRPAVFASGILTFLSPYRLVEA